MSFKKRRASNCLPLKIAQWAIIAFVVVMAVLVFFPLIKTGMVPRKYLYMASAIIGGIVFLSVIAMAKKGTNILMIIISGLLAAGLIYVYLFSGALTSALTKVTTITAEKTVISVAVKKDSPYQTIEDLKGKNIGYASIMQEKEREDAKANITQATGSCNFVEKFGVITEAKDLLEGKADAAILTDSYISLIKETQGYKNFEDEIRILYTFEVDTQKDVSDHTAHPENAEIFTLYISGIDTRSGKFLESSRSDVNIFAVVNMKTKHILLVNTPRDYYVPSPASNGVDDKLTHAGIYGVKNSIGALEDLYDEKINYYLRVNFNGFKNIIDSVGGVDVYSQHDFTSSLDNSGYSYKKGYNHINGEAALYFARERYSFADGDYQRGRNQMAVIEAIVKKLTSSTDFLTNYKSLLSSIADSFQTTMPADTIYNIVSMQLSDSSKWTIETTEVSGKGSKERTYSMPDSYQYVTIPDMTTVDEAKEKMESVKAETELKKVTETKKETTSSNQ